MGARNKSYVTAGVCEPVLLTLVNKGLTMTKNRRRHRGWERGRQREGSSKEKDGDSCSTVVAIKTPKVNLGQR